MPKKPVTRLLIALVLICVLIFVASIRQPIESNSGTKFNKVNVSSTGEASKATQSMSTSTLRVASYNIARGKGTDGIRDIHRTSGILANFDIIGLSEVGGFPLTNHAEEIGRDLEMAWQFAPNQKRWLYDYFGNAMLSNLTVTSWHSQMLPRDIKKNRAFRNYLVAKFEWQGKEIVVITTHLGRGELVNVQLDLVMQTFLRYPHAILMGDFNLMPDSPLWQAYLDKNEFSEAATNTPVLAHHQERLDYIFVRGLRIVNSGNHPRGISDHPMIWAEVELDSEP